MNDQVKQPVEIVSFEDIGRNKEDWHCYPCNRNGVMRDADVALLNSNGARITGLCAHHAEVFIPRLEEQS